MRISRILAAIAMIVFGVLCATTRDGMIWWLGMPRIALLAQKGRAYYDAAFLFFLTLFIGSGPRFRRQIR
jgi:hypothetical protein